MTGATGFIGRHCLEPLLEKGYEVHALTVDTTAGTPAGIQWHPLDIFDNEGLARLVGKVKPECLLHLAWYTAHGLYWTSAENLRWCRATLELLRLFAANGGRRVTVAGTCAEYDWTQGLCQEGVTPESPRTLYGVCKKAMHDITMAFAAQEGISAAWGRVFFLYGPGEYKERLVPSVVRALLEGREAHCTHGKQVRDFLHVEDVARAFVSILASDVTGAVNIGSGEPLALRELMMTVAKAVGREDLVRLGARPVPPDEPPILTAQVDRLTNETEWRPRYSLGEGIETTVAWWREMGMPALS
jgi:nucleoside-diphosphate-sugar epimerase